LKATPWHTPFLKKDISLPAQRVEYLKPGEFSFHSQNTTYSKGNSTAVL
jgi:hypothetical protein